MVGFSVCNGRCTTTLPPRPALRCIPDTPPECYLAIVMIHSKKFSRCFSCSKLRYRFLGPTSRARHPTSIQCRVAQGINCKVLVCESPGQPAGVYRFDERRRGKVRAAVSRIGRCPMSHLRTCKREWWWCVVGDKPSNGFCEKSRGPRLGDPLEPYGHSLTPWLPTDRLPAGRPALCGSCCQLATLPLMARTARDCILPT